MKKAVIKNNDGAFYVVFGFEYKGELIVAHGKSGKSYGTKSGAEKAKAKWESS